jgi:uncharacterized protein YggE
MSTTNDTTNEPHDDGSRADHRRRMRRGVAGALVVIAALALIGDILAGVALGRPTALSARSTITVTGSGTAHGTPDTVNFQIGVSTVAKSAAGALAENNSRVASLEKALTGHGVTLRNMQTSGLNLYANYDNNGNVTGFTAEDDLSVTLHQIAKAGDAIDAAANAAGNGAQLNGLTFSISNQSKLLESARTAAMHNAYVEASQIARAGKTTLGSIVRVTDQENAATGQVIYPTAAGTRSFSSVPIQAGSQAINVQVTVVYALNG